MRLLTSILFVLVGHLSFAQTVDCSNSANCSDPYCQFAANIEKGCNCFDGLDNDGDGKVDKADSNCATYYGLVFVGEDSDCSIVPPGANTPFDLVKAPITSDQNTADTQSKISVGDVDGDGIPDAIITSKWNQEIRVVATASGQADGTKPGQVKADFKTTGQGAKIFSGTGGCSPKSLLFEHENLIADIDGDGKSEMFGVVSNRGGNPSTPPTCFFLVGFTYAPGTLQPLYNAIQIGTDRPGTFGIADMDGDGKAEIYLRDRIYAAETGALLATGNGNWDLDITSGPVAVDVTGDNKMELVCGTKIYGIPNLSNRNPATPANLTLVADMNTITADKAYVKLAVDPIEYGTDTHSMCSVADIDRDGNMDVVISGALNSVNGPTAVFYWNVAKGTVSHYIVTDPAYPNGWPWGTGRVNLGDANGDGKMDLTFIAGAYLHCLTTDASGNLVPLWPTPRTINDTRSGVLTVSIYDFNNDGDPEVVYRDSQELAVIDGATGQTKIWSAICQSHTYTEGPVIADVNGDGATDICVACNTSKSFDINDPIQQQALGQFRLYYSSGNEWLPTRKVWNQPGYFVVNINDDLTLPFPQLAQNLVFGEGDCLNGLPGPQMPMNVFLNQVPFLSANGCPVYPAPDLSFIGDNPDQPGVDANGDGIYSPAVEVFPPICGDLAISVRFNIVNDGDLPITANIPVSFFIGDPTNPAITSDSLIHSASLPINNLQVDSTYQSPLITFNGTGKPFRLYIVLNNDGTILPINPNGSVTNECRIDNNIYSAFIQPDPFTTKIEKIKDNFKCVNTAPDNGELRVRIFKGGVEVTDYSQYGFQWYTGTAASHTAIAGATNYNITGLAEGDYTAIVTNTVKGCVGVPVDTVILRQGNDPEVVINVISHQTVCNPPNGELQAQITGGNAGFTFEWFDIALNPLGISGPTANNLVAGNYLVRVSKDGCTKNSLPQTVDGPVVPDATATTLQNVVDCLNPQSGSVSATALFNGAPQDPANYSFEWYFYDNATSTRGSILPAIHGTGETRTGLPVGFYQVVVTDVATQCVAVQTPFTEITSQTVIPTATIAELAPLTSCDPANPNGRLQAFVDIGGVMQDPSGFTFEWFKGDNTLPVNAHTSVSGVNNSVAESVSGGGVFYTVKVTTANHCSDTEKRIITEDINLPVVTLVPTDNGICDPALAATAYNGTVTASVTFDGAVVSDFTNYQITWHDGAMTSNPVIPGETTVLIDELDGGFYTAVVERTDLGCVSPPVTAEVINNLALPVIGLDSIPSTNCVPVYKGNPISNGQAMVATVDNAAPNANHAFRWSDNGSTTDVDGQTTPTILNIQGGFVYTVEVTNKLTGCQNSKAITVPDNSVVPVVSLNVAQPNSICDPALTIPSTQFNGRIEATFLTPSGNIADYTYTWRNTTDGIALGNTPPLNNGQGVTQPFEYGGLNGDKDYTVVAENTVLGCISGVAQVYLPNAVALPVIETDSVASTNCVLNYGGNMIANGQAFVATVDGAPPTADYTFRWSDNGSTTGVGGRTTQTITQIQGGFIYTVEVTNRLTGCRNTDPVPLADASVVPVVSLTVAQPNSICNPALTVPAAQFNGRIQADFLTPSGNIADYKYTWRNVTEGIALGDTPPLNNGQGVTQFFEFGGLNGDRDYTVVAENTVLGCTSGVAQVFLPNDFQLPVIETDSIPSTNCVVDFNGVPVSNGQVSVTSVDAGAPFADYSFLWSDDGLTPTTTSANTPSVTNLEGGFQYSVLVTRKTTGCANTHVINLPADPVRPVITVTKTADNVNCSGTPTGELEALVSYRSVAQNNPGGAPALPGNYVLTWSVAGSADILSGQSAGTYTATVVDESLGCTSDPDADVVLDVFEYPQVALVPTSQTSCDSSTPNGALQATLTASTGTLAYQWYEDVGTNGTPIGTLVPAQASGTVASITDRVSDDYSIYVRNELTGCESIRSAFIPNLITYPAITFQNVNPVTICAPTPNGSAEPSVTGLSALPTVNFDIYYVYTFEGDSYPTNPAVIKASTDPNNIINGTGPINPGVNPPVYADMTPGYLTAMVVDRNTKCESNAQTVQIVNNTQDYSITIDGTSAAGFCNGVGGGVSVTVEREDQPGLDCNTCSYTWYKGVPSNSDINFFNNPPDMGAALPQPLVWGGVGNDKNLGLLDDGVTGRAPGVGAGTYTLVVVDTDPLHQGCGNYFVEAIPFNNPPVITVTETDVTKCVAPFDGQIEVDVNGGGSLAGYIINLYSGTNPSGALLSTTGPAAPVNLASAPTLAKGDYYVEVIDQDPANTPCPLASVHRLEQRAFGPQITLNQIVENTACDAVTSADGKVELTATADSQQDTGVNPTDFTITAISPAPLGLAFPLDIPDDGTSSGLLSGFSPQSYTITVTDANSGCATDAVVSIPDQPVLPTIFTVDSFNDSYCAPSSNGRIEVTSVGVGGPEPPLNYEFEWYSSPDVAVPANLVYSAVGGGATTGEVFNGSKGGWSFGPTPGAGNGNRTYYVRGRRITGSGIGCFTQLEQKDVIDVHKTPNLALTTFDNTSCLPGTGEGVLRAVSDIAPDPLDGNVVNGTYTYSWNPDPAGGNASPANLVGRLVNFDITALTDDTYTVTTINSVNGCSATGTAVIKTNPLPITLLSYSKTDQLICNPDGSINVTAIQIDATNTTANTVYSFNTPANLVANFDFKWFDSNNDGDGNAATYSNTPIQNGGVDINDDILTDDGALTTQPFATMGKGTYYVIATRKPGMTPGAGCTTVPVRVDVGRNVNNPVITALNPFANTSCDAGTVEGRIELTVQTTSGVPAESGSTYSYTWTQGDPLGNPGGAGTANNVANATAVSTMTLPQGYVTPPLIGPALKDDTYTITVRNDYSGCSVTGQAVITRQKFPVTLISFTKQDQLICGPDGRITVTQVTIDGSTSNLPLFNYSTPAELANNFDFAWFDSNNDGDKDPNTFSTSGATLQSGGAPITDVVLSEDPGETTQPFADMGIGSYYVLATRKPGMMPGAGCATLPVRVNIEDKHINPVITSIQPFANTSCDASIVEGRIELIVDTNSGVAAEAGSTYSYTWVQSNPAGNPGGAGNIDNVANATATSLLTIPQGYVAPPAIGPALKDDTYTITVRNDYSNCTTTGQAVITPQRYPITLISFTKQDQLICDPDGRITVTGVTIDGSTSKLPVYNFTTTADLRTNFDFAWFDSNNDGDNNAATYDVTLPLTDGINPLADVVLSEDIAETIQPYAAMGAGSYYVVAKRKPGLTPGAGCLTEPVRVNIEDLHSDPTTSFAFTPNSSCDPMDPNGQLIATAQERDGSTDAYTFAWTLNTSPLPGVTTQADVSPISQLDNAYEGDYALEVKNTMTGCTFTSGIVVNLDLNISLPNIINVDTTDPTNCIGDGSAEVTSISIGGGPPVTGAILGTAFQYEWYDDDFAPGNRLANTAPLLPALTPGKYYVLVQDLETDCKSAPTEVVIVDDDIVYPVITIRQTALQISCITTTGTAGLQATADMGQTDANPNYSFTWFNNLDTTPPSFASTSTITDLVDGDYSVLVTNSITGCSSNDIYIIKDDSQTFMPQLSLNTEARVDCLTPDGTLLAREVGQNQGNGYPFPISYTTEYYIGDNVDVSQPGIVMANVPGFNRNWFERNLDAGPYTVKITDNNTGCSVSQTDVVEDQRTPPLIEIMEDNPLINCDPAIANGQLSATADGGHVGGYQFNWFSGVSASGAVVSANNKLIGISLGDFTVRVTNETTHCFADATSGVTDGRLAPPTPTAELVFDRTRCDYPDGWVAANVGGITFNYTFDWYDGTGLKPSADFAGANYQNRDIGFYTVTATDQVTGCVSGPTSIEVKDLRVIPEVIVNTTPSYCEELPGAVGGNGTAQIQLNPADVVSDEVTWTMEDDATPIDIGSYLTNVLPGFYQANVVTSQGCRAYGVGEVRTEVFSYNLVSTNGDRKNDNFRIDCITQFPNNNVKIFNRAGVLVYEADGYDNNDVVFQGIGKKGIYTIGNELPVGTYFYIIDKRDGSKPKTGYLELVR